MRTYYASCEYENEAEPGEYAAITILGDDDGPHLVFSTDEVVILDLPIPACEALAVSYALARSAKNAIVAAEHLTERLADLRTSRSAEPPEHAHVEHVQLPAVPVGALPVAPAVAPPAGMTPYGRRELEPGAYPPRDYPPPALEVRGEPVQAPAQQAPEPPVNHTRPLPCPSGSRLRRAG